LNVLEQEVYLTSEFEVTDRIPQVAKYVKATFITFSINCVSIVGKLTLMFA